MLIHPPWGQETTYLFRTVAVNAVGASNYSTVLEVTTGLPDPPAAPTQFQQTELWKSGSTPIS